MDVFTYHTLMMGNTKLGRFYRVLSLYDEAIKSNAKVNYSDLTEILQTIQAQVIVDAIGPKAMVIISFTQRYERIERLVIRLYWINYLH